MEGKSVEEKDAQPTERTAALYMMIVKQNRFKNLGVLHKEWTEAGVKASGATIHRRVKEFGYSSLRWLWKRSPYQVLSTYTVDEHTFQKANNSLKMFFYYWSYEVF